MWDYADADHLIALGAMRFSESTARENESKMIAITPGPFRSLLAAHGLQATAGTRGPMTFTLRILRHEANRVGGIECADGMPLAPYTLTPVGQIIGSGVIDGLTGIQIDFGAWQARHGRVGPM